MSVQQPFFRAGVVALAPSVVVVTVAGAGSTVAPAGYTSYTGEAIGGGGAGFGSSTFALRASGAGGQYAKSNAKIAITPGATIFYYVGQGGPPTDSWVNTTNAAPTSATTGALAKAGGSGSSGAGGVGNVAGSIGATINFGGNGMTDTGGNPTGGGAAGASGPGAMGTPGSGSSGAGGIAGTDTTGLSPSQPMGGGNGGLMGSTGLYPGGGPGGRSNSGVLAGATGQIRIVFYS